MSDFKFSIRAGAFGVHNPLGDTFAIEMGEKVNQMEVLKKEGPVLTDPLTRLGVIDGASIRSGVNRLLLVFEGALVVCDHFGLYCVR